MLYYIITDKKAVILTTWKNIVRASALVIMKRTKVFVS